MKAAKTFYIGLFVALLSIVQFLMTFSATRIIGVSVGIFCMILGWKIGWTQYRKFTVLLGHIVLTAGCLVTAYAVYQIPFLAKPPTLIEVLDLPLFWGLFTIFGGYCMITHSYCACAMKMHAENNKKPSSK
jgi:hypothetical protein